VACADQIRKVINIVRSDSDRKIIVVSAPGKRRPDDTKVTDLLIRCARRVLDGREAEAEIDGVIGRYAGIASDLGLSPALAEDFRKDLDARLAEDTSCPERFEDAVKAAGEDYNARLIAAAFQKAGVQAEYVHPRDAGLLVSEEYGQARVLKESYSRVGEYLRGRDKLTVFPGFFGCSPNGHLVTFSRGGSDLTGAILAVAVGADVYENFTDVDGISAADPTLVESPALINELTYQELRELSYGGFTVFHDEAVMPVYGAGIPINVKNTNNPSHAGTWVVVSREPEPGSIVGIACDSGFCAVYVGKYLMNREKGFGRKLLQIVEEENLSFDHMPTGVDNVTIVLKENQLTEHTVEHIKERIHRELDADTVSVEYGLAILSIVGVGMRRSIGICARVAGALADAGVNIEMIVQGPSELTMIVGIKAEDVTDGVNAIYNEFFQTHGRSAARQ